MAYKRSPRSPFPGENAKKVVGSQDDDLTTMMVTITAIFSKNCTMVEMGIKKKGDGIITKTHVLNPLLQMEFKITESRNALDECNSLAEAVDKLMNQQRVHNY